MAEVVRDFTVHIPVDEKGCNVPGCLLVVWDGLDGDDSGKPYVAPHRSIKSIQVEGTYDSGSVAMQGTLEQCYDTNGVAQTPTWGALSDVEGATIAVTAGNVPLQIQEMNTLGIRPVVSGGGGSCSLKVSMLISFGRGH